MLAPALRRHVGDGSLDEFEQRLLYPFARHVASDGRTVALAADLVDFIDVDDATLGPFYIVIRCLQKLEDDVFHVFADVSCLREGGGIGQREGDVQVLCQGLGQQRFSRACRAQHENVPLLELHVVNVLVLGRDSLVVVMNGHRKNFLRPLLSHDVLVQVVFDFHRLFELRRNLFFGLFPILGNDVVAEIHAFVADIDGGPELICGLRRGSFHKTSSGDVDPSYPASPCVPPCYLSLAVSFPVSRPTALRSFGGLVMTSSMRRYRFASSADMK